MTVTLDPSEVRRQATVKGPLAGIRLRLPLRTLLLGGLGGAGLLAFTIGAFSFFGGLADPRVRTVRPAPVASKMPDLKDGLPALVAEAGSAAPAASVLNLPRPAASTPAPAADSERREVAKAEVVKAEIGKTEEGLRTGRLAAAEPVVGASHSAPASAPAADATGSVMPRKASSARAKASPIIENAATVAGDGKSVPLIAPARTAGPLAPAKAETVRAKPVAVAAVASEQDIPAPAAPKTAAQDAAPEPKPAAGKKPAQKTARAKDKPVVEASADPEAGPAPATAPEEDGFTSKVNRGIKAIEGLFGQE